ncbi:MAG: hypothetical protein Q9217_004865 [Psora testacea]
MPSSVRVNSLLKQLSAEASEIPTEDQATHHTHQNKLQRSEFELNVTEDPPTSDQLRTILEYVGARKASQLVDGARDDADALKKLKEEPGRFKPPVTFVFQLLIDPIFGYLASTSTMEDHLVVETVVGSNALPKGHGPAIFSTDRCRNPAREAYHGQQREVRSNRNEAIAKTASDLRAKFPVECIAIRPEDIQQQGPVLNEYFDNFDIYFYSPKFLWDVMLYIAKSNEAGRAERINDVEDFVNGWIIAKKEAFYLITAEHQWHDLFTSDEIEGYGFHFLWDAFWKIAQIREHHDNAAQLRRVHEGRDWQKQTAENAASYTCASALAVRNPSASRLAVHASTTAAVPSLLPLTQATDLRSTHYAQRLQYQSVHAQKLSNQGYASRPRHQRTMSQGSLHQWLSTGGGVTPFLQASMAPTATHTFTVVDRIGSQAQDSKTPHPGLRTRRDYNSDPITQAWDDRPNYTPNSITTHSAGLSGPFQYERMSTCNRRFSSATSSRNAHLYRGFRNPPKQVSDDARRSSVEYVRSRAEDEDTQNQHSQGANPANAPIVPRDMPRFVSNPWATAMGHIDEECESAIHPQYQPIHRQKASTASAQDPMVSNFQQKWTPAQQSTPQSYPDRRPLIQMPNAGSGLQHIRSSGGCKMWVGNVPLHLTQEQLHQLFQTLKGFVSVSEVKRTNRNYTGTDYVERGWVLVNFRTSEEVAEALTMLPDSEILQGQPLVANKFHPRYLQQNNCGLQRNESMIVQPSPNLSRSRRLLSADRAGNTLQEPVYDEVVGSAPRTNPSLNNDLPSHTLEPQISRDTTVLHESVGERPSSLKALPPAKSLDLGAHQPETAVDSALKVPQPNNKNFAAENGLTLPREGGIAIKKKSKSKKKKAKDGDQKPQADPAVSESSTKPTEPGKDFSKDFPPLAGSSAPLSNNALSMATAVVPHIGTKSFAKAASHAASSTWNEGPLLSPNRPSPRLDGQLDGSHEAFIAKTGASHSSLNLSGDSTIITDGQVSSTSSIPRPDTEGFKPASQSISQTFSSSLDSNTGSNPISITEAHVPRAITHSKTRNSSSSGDNSAISTPAAFTSTGVTSYQQSSRSNSKAYDEQPMTGNRVANEHTPGINAERIWSRLQSNALQQGPTYTDISEEHEQRLVDTVLQKAVEKLDQAATIPLEAPATPTLPTPSPRTPSPSSGGPEMPERRNLVSQPSSPGPITTHKKSTRQRNSTPTRRSFPKSSRAAQAASPSPSQYRFSSPSPPNTPLVVTDHGACAANSLTTMKSPLKADKMEVYSISDEETRPRASQAISGGAGAFKDPRASAITSLYDAQLITAKQLPSLARSYKENTYGQNTSSQSIEQVFAEDILGAIAAHGRHGDHSKLRIEEESQENKRIGMFQLSNDTGENTVDTCSLPTAPGFGLTLAQKVIRNDVWPSIINQHNECTRSPQARPATRAHGITLPPIPREAGIHQNTASSPSTHTSEEPSMKHYIATALVLERKLCRLMESPLAASIIERATKLYAECPATQHTDHNKPLQLSEQVAWNVKVASWVDSLPVALTFNAETGKALSKVGKRIEKQLERSRMDYVSVHLGGNNPVEGLSSRELATGTDALLGEASKIGQNLVGDPADMNAQMIWNTKATGWIHRNQEAGRWTAEEKPPSDMIRMMKANEEIEGTESPDGVTSTRTPDTMRVEKSGQTNITQLPTGNDPFQIQLNAIEMVHKIQEREIANQYKQTILAGLSTSRSEEIAAAKAKKHNNLESMIETDEKHSLCSTLRSIPDYIKKQRAGRGKRT